MFLIYNMLYTDFPIRFCIPNKTSYPFYVSRDSCKICYSNIVGTFNRFSEEKI